jgi:hypothetical protein
MTRTFESAKVSYLSQVVSTRSECVLFFLSHLLGKSYLRQSSTGSTGLRTRQKANMCDISAQNDFCFHTTTATSLPPVTHQPDTVCMRRRYRSSTNRRRTTYSCSRRRWRTGQPGSRNRSSGQRWAGIDLRMGRRSRVQTGGMSAFSTVHRDELACCFLSFVC